MQQIIYFIKKFRYFLLFLVLEILAFYFTIQHHSYHKSKFVNSANAVTGGFYKKTTALSDYFYLSTENKILIEENARLRNLLAKKDIEYNSTTFLVNDSSKFTSRYEYTSAKIIKNDYTQRNNFLTLNKGENQGLLADMGVINGKGIIGVINSTSNNFATVLSILNKSSKINVSLKNSNHFGTLIWNGVDYNIVQVTDIPRQAQLKVGDTIITGGKSIIFPEGILVGSIKDFIFENNQYQQINVQLFNDMSAIGYVEVIKNLEKEEQLKLEQNILNE
ncbi:rod shape-determining protein MreC [Lutibacter agarilyticus]|uniref:Cell shape-determining protein MreC n=1 Tax=Lutibacter agarilyticus TaxID=1109740 RepID=A0A238WQF6_9FLAO|nr:rod shape-determining protein MreC [Lutibacter agarilyticus]SNR47899.1 rod shape-determining protein MreC [Lutibacter agarilyticus]